MKLRYMEIETKAMRGRKPASFCFFGVVFMNYCHTLSLSLSLRPMLNVVGIYLC